MDKFAICLIGLIYSGSFGVLSVEDQSETTQNNTSKKPGDQEAPATKGDDIEKFTNVTKILNDIIGVITNTTILFNDLLNSFRSKREVSGLIVLGGEGNQLEDFSYEVFHVVNDFWENLGYNIMDLIGNALQSAFIDIRKKRETGGNFNSLFRALKDFLPLSEEDSFIQ